MTFAEIVSVTGQIAGWLQFAVTLPMYISTRRSRVLAIKLTSDLLGTVNMLCTGFRAAGAYTNSVAIAREIVFYQRTRHKWADRKIWLFLFMGLMAAAPVFDFAVRGSFVWLSLLPAAGSLIAAVALFGKKMLTSKILIIASQVPYLAYNFLAVGDDMKTVISFNIPGIVICSMTDLSAAAGIVNEIVTAKRKKKEAEEEEEKENGQGPTEDGRPDRA